MLVLALTSAVASDFQIDVDVDLNANIRIGETVRITSRNDGNVYSLGEALIIDAPVEGQVGGLAQDIHVTKAGSIGGDLTLAGETLVLDGPVSGDIKGAMRVFDLNSRVDGAVHIALEEAKVGPKARIDGDLDYESEARIPALEKVVRGAVTWEKSDTHIEFNAQ